MKEFQNPKRGELNAGRNLASIYTMDLIEEHFQNFRSKEELDNWMLDNNSKLLLDELLSMHYTNQRSKYSEMLRNPTIFRYKNYVKGFIYKILKFIKCILTK